MTLLYFLALLLTSLVGADSNDICKIFSSIHSESVTINDFANKSHLIPANGKSVRLLHEITLTTAYTVKVRVEFNQDVSLPLSNLRIDVNNAVITSFLPNKNPNVVQVVGFDGVLKTTDQQGQFSVLNGAVSYTVVDSMEATSIYFVIDKLVTLKVVVGEPNARGEPVITLDQTHITVDDLRYEPFGLCTYFS